MRVRFTDNPTIEGFSGRFNIASIDEVIVGFDVGGADSCYIRDLDIQIGDEWMTLQEAFKNHDVIIDNYNTHFFEPRNQEDRERGYVG